MCHKGNTEEGEHILILSCNIWFNTALPWSLSISCFHQCVFEQCVKDFLPNFWILGDSSLWPTSNT